MRPKHVIEDEACHAEHPDVLESLKIEVLLDIRDVLVEIQQNTFKARIALDRTG
jgi:hypothetical protein